MAPEEMIDINDNEARLVQPDGTVVDPQSQLDQHMLDQAAMQ